MSVTPKSSFLGTAVFLSSYASGLKETLFELPRNVFIQWCVQKSGHIQAPFACRPQVTGRKDSEDTLQALAWSHVEISILVKLIPFPKVHTSVHGSLLTKMKIKICLYRVLFNCESGKVQLMVFYEARLIISKATELTLIYSCMHETTQAFLSIYYIPRNIFLPIQNAK